MKIGFIGLGLMGSPMAKNILKAKFPLTVYNRTAKKTLEFKKLRADVALGPKELAEKSDVIITMVTGPTDVEEVLFGTNGVVGAGVKGLTVIDMSTIGPEAAKNIAKKLAKFKIDFIDAPVTGSTPKAITGELTIFIGGKKTVFEKIKPVLTAMGTNLLYIGPTGSGQAVKLINNHLIATTLASLCEGLLLADAQGINRKKAMTALEQTPAFSPFMKLKLPFLLKHHFPTLFSLSNMAKDLDLAVGETKRAKKKLRLLETVEKYHQEGVKHSLGDQDNSSILKVIEKEAEK